MSELLREHQRTGAAWLAARTHGCLADAPGLGKTRTLLAALAGRADRPLVVCPAMVRTHWHREAALLGYPDVIIKSYDEVVRGGKSMMARLTLTDKVDALIVDEHHYCKNPGAQRTRTLFGNDGYARRVPTVYLASGTPITKHPGELGPLLIGAFPAVATAHGIKTLADFDSRFVIKEDTSYIQGGKRVFQERATAAVRNGDEFARILSEIMLRRTDGGADIPDLDWQPLLLDAIGDDRGDDPFSECTPIVRAAIERGELIAVANDPSLARARRRLGVMKAKSIGAILAGQLADTDEKIVVFAHHRDALDALRRGLEPFGVAYVDGDTSPKARDAAIDGFQRAGGPRVFVGQNIACQTGITLHAARRCVLVEPDWTHVVNEQLGKRIARLGSAHRSCIAQVAVLAGTLDERIVARNRQEQELLAELIG